MDLTDGPQEASPMNTVNFPSTAAVTPPPSSGPCSHMTDDYLAGITHNLPAVNRQEARSTRSCSGISWQTCQTIEELTSIGRWGAVDRSTWKQKHSSQCLSARDHQSLLFFFFFPPLLMLQAAFCSAVNTRAEVWEPQGLTDRRRQSFITLTLARRHFAAAKKQNADFFSGSLFAFKLLRRV